ncbi:MAG: hypothetical protein AAGJ29_09690 [Pseudomonadota bacterium]
MQTIFHATRAAGIAAAALFVSGPLAAPQSADQSEEPAAQSGAFVRAHLPGNWGEVVTENAEPRIGFLCGETEMIFRNDTDGGLLIGRTGEPVLQPAPVRIDEFSVTVDIAAVIDGAEAAMIFMGNPFGLFLALPSEASEPVSRDEESSASVTRQRVVPMMRCPEPEVIS